MIKRIFMTAAVLGGLLGVSAYANTFVVGVEENPLANDTTEGIGDFNDMMLQFGAAGLTATSTGSWLGMGTVTLQTTTNTGSPFWNNKSQDGADQNIGYQLNSVLCSGCPLTTPPAEYLSNGGAPVDFTFSFSGAISTIYIGSITPNRNNESIGIYSTSNGQVQWIVQNNVNVVGSSFTPDFSSFGLVYEDTTGGADIFFSQNGLGAYVNGVYTPSGVPDNRFALFQTADSVPEPGTMALFGLGALAFGLIPRLRKRR